MDAENKIISNQPLTPISGFKKHFSFFGVLLSLAYATSFYVGIGAMITVIFYSISKIFPEVGSRYDYYGYSGVRTSWYMAVLVVSFIVFMIMAFFLGKNMEKAKKEGRETGKNVFYLNIFLSALALASSLVTVLYYFFDGREFTASFVLKILTVLIISCLVFGYYFGEIRFSFSGRGRKIWAAVGVLCVLFSLTLSFSAFGFPRTARLHRADNQKVELLMNIQNQTIDYWRTKKIMPKSVEEINNSRSLEYDKLPLADQEGKPIIYRLTGDYSFELCAEFNLDAPLDWQNLNSYPNGYNYDKTLPLAVEKDGGMESLNNWTYKKGPYCFKRTLDPSFYKPYN